MSYTVTFSKVTTPQIFQAFRNAANWLCKREENYNRVVLLPLFEQEFNIKLSELKEDDMAIRYTAKFKSEQDYVWFLLRWS